VAGKERREWERVWAGGERIKIKEKRKSNNILML
jgi:hypothetical protein